jgi:GH24 family phage-related lysozyme (muramidase)
MANDTGVGFNAPMFFVGVVENNEDPRLEGRVQVRAFGVHGTNRDIPTEDLPWATLIIGSHDTNFVVPPLNAWVLGLFLDGRDAQQPMILGLIPTQMLEPIDPEKNGWGVALGQGLDVGAMGHRHRDFGEPMVSRYARGESTEGTIYPALESNRRVDVEVAGAPQIESPGNRNQYGGDTGSAPPAPNSAEDFDETERLIAGFEGFREAAYQDYGQTSIGYGTRARPGETRITEAEARSRLRSEVNATRRQVVAYGQRYGYNWNNNQIAALTSFSYNVGIGAPATSTRNASGLYQLTGGDRGTGGGRSNAEIGRMMLQYNRAGGEVLPGLTTRRRDESNLFLTPDGAQGTAQPAADPAAAGDSGEPITPAEPRTTWSEPVSGYMPQYPFNRVLETPGGHVIEVDSTQRAERIMVWHPSGSYVQMTPTTNTYKSTRDHYDVMERSHHISVGGNNYLTIDGNYHLLVKGNMIEEVRGDYQQVVHGNLSMGSGGQIAINGAEETQIRSARLDLQSNVENLNLKVGKKLVITAGEEMHFKGNGVFIESEADVNIKAADNFNVGATTANIKAGTAYIESGGALDLKGGHVKIGGGSKVSVSASIVAVDDIIQLSSGASTTPEGVQAEAAAAESATDVEMDAPPDRSVNLAGAPTETEPSEGDSGSAGQTAAPPTDQAPSQATGPTPFRLSLQSVDLVGTTGGVALIRDGTGHVRTVREGQRVPGTDFTVATIASGGGAVTVVDSAGNTQTMVESANIRSRNPSA